MPPVIVYSKPACVQCNAVYRFLDKNGVTYEVRDLSHPAHAEALSDFQAKGIMQAPIVQAEGVDLFVGFHPGYLAQVKAKHGMGEQ